MPRRYSLPCMRHHEVYCVVCYATNTDPQPKPPIATGVLDYFPDAIAELALVSLAGNEQHTPGAPLVWDRSKSGDEANSGLRHFMKRGTRDTDGQRHTAKFAWRALALLQKEIENEHRK